MGANAAVAPGDSTEAMAVALAATTAAVSASTLQVVMPIHVTCSGGGSVTFTVSGGNPLKWFNGVLDVGERYVLSFDRCQSTIDAPPVSGTLSLLVNDPGSATLSVSTSTVNLSVALPLRTVTLNGNSTLTQTVAANFGNTSTTHRWQSPDVQVTSRRNGFDSLFRLTAVDYSRTDIVAVNGVPVSSSFQGGSTVNADLAFLTWFITLATIGPISYDATGVILQGIWRIDMPNDRVTVDISGQRVSLQFDLGKDGSIDLSFIIDLATFLDAAG